MVALVWKCYADMLCCWGKNSVWPYLLAARQSDDENFACSPAATADALFTHSPTLIHTHLRERKIMEHPRLPYNDDDKVSYAPLYTPRRRGNEKYTF
jgi:hypothetical protein